METITITIHADVLADRKFVWDCYTLPQHITQWNFATDDWQCPTASNDMRVGGIYAARMEAKDGSFGFDFEATYTEIVPGERFSYTIADGRNVSVRFSQNDTHTEVVVAFEAESQNSPERQRSGWQAILNNFKKYTEAQHSLR